MYLLPALLLFAVLLFGRRPGEQLIVELHARRARRRRELRVAASFRRGEAASVPRGGRLIARALAGRAPPTARAAFCGV